MEFRDTTKWYFENAPNLQAEDLKIGHFALLNKIKIEQSPSSKSDARWSGHYRVTTIAQSFGTYGLAELGGAQLVGWMDDRQLEKVINRHKAVHGTRQISKPSTTQEELLEECGEYEVHSVARVK
jgi:hypothetical protein